MRREERVQFPGADGSHLTGRLRWPEGSARAFVLFAHCFTCGKDLRIASRIAGRMADAGFAVLRFDFTGLGESEGDFADTTFSSNVADLAAAADFLRGQHRAPSILVGHSLGGAAVLAVAHRIPEAVAVVTIAAPAEPSHVVGLLQCSLTELESRGEAEVSIAGRSFTIRKQFLDDLSEQEQRARIRELNKALLVLHSPEDTVVDIENATRIFQLARHPRSFISLDGADHLLSRSEDADYAGITIAAWASRYVPSLPAPDAATERSKSGEVVARLGAEGYAVDITAGPHRMRADEPKRSGGMDTGGTPYDYLLASLGACTAMTMRMYAMRKGWPLDSVTSTLTHRRVHAKDCAECESTDGAVAVIERHIELSGPLTTEQRSRLLEIADRCPVHQTLENEIKIHTTSDF